MSSLTPDNEQVTIHTIGRGIEMMQERWRDTLQIGYQGMMLALCAEYTNLLKELHKNQVLVTPAALEMLANRPQELVVFLMKNTELLGTAQASLCFPALVPTVHISNVVVSAKVRGRGFGTVLMNSVVQLSEQIWRKESRLVFQLTSQEMRGTKAFYEKLGYWSTPTIRYKRLL